MSRIAISTSSFNLGDNPVLEELAAGGVEIVTNPHGRRLTEEEVSSLLDGDTIGLIAGVEPLTGRVLASHPALKIISRCGTGTDNVDMAAAQERGIVVRRTPEAPAAAVAELSIGLMLAALRHIAESDRRLRSGDWHRPAGGLLGRRTVGVVGLGAIGRRVAEFCHALGATVLAVDPEPAALPSGVELTSLENLLEQADVISLHVPQNDRTERMIDEAALSRMRKEAILVNTSRAGVVDEQALVEALAAQKLAAAALDVFEHEPYQGPLTAMDNVVLTPHIGSNTRETRRLMELEAAENLVNELHKLGLLPARGTDE